MHDYQGIAKRFYTAEEYTYLMSLATQPAQLDYFYRAWVIKEAVLKACGLGLAFGLDKVSVGGLADTGNHGQVDLMIDGQRQTYYWQLIPHEMDAACPLAIAANQSFVISKRSVCP